MATDPRKRQKKLERRTAKRQDKKHKIVRAQSAGLADRMTAAAKYPVLQAWVQDVYYTEGIGSVLLSRELPDGSVAVAVFLVDRYCLGVKNALADVFTRLRLRKQVRAANAGAVSSQQRVAGAGAQLVESAVAYAGNLGFAPHPDYHKAKLLFGTIDANECTEEFELGKDGKPFYVAGPNDSLQRSRQIISILNSKLGPGGFDYLVPLANPEDFLPDALLQGSASNNEAEESENLLDFQDELPEES